MIEENTDTKATSQESTYHVYNSKNYQRRHKDSRGHHHHHHLSAATFKDEATRYKKKKRVIANTLFLILGTIALVIIIAVYWLYTNE